jgi:hypothetical protein
MLTGETPGPIALIAVSVAVAVNNTAQQLSSKVCTSVVTLKAPDGNSETLYLGNSSAVNSGAYPLDPGESIPVEINNLSKIWIYGKAGDTLKVFGS